MVISMENRGNSDEMVVMWRVYGNHTGWIIEIDVVWVLDDDDELDLQQIERVQFHSQLDCSSSYFWCFLSIEQRTKYTKAVYIAYRSKKLLEKF